MGEEKALPTDKALHGWDFSEDEICTYYACGKMLLRGGIYLPILSQYKKNLQQLYKRRENSFMSGIFRRKYNRHLYPKALRDC